eukprot:gene1910-2168_t
MQVFGAILVEMRFKQEAKKKTSILEERLMVTLRLIASGDSQQSHSFSFRIGRATVSKILRATCEALWVALNNEYLNLPSTTEDWVRISKELEDSWNFPHCIGAIDGNMKQ